MRILVATDGSDGAGEAVAQAIELAPKLDAEITFVAVEHLPPAPFGLPPYYVVDTAQRDLAQAAVSEAIAAATEAGVPADGRVLPPGDTAGDIVSTARELDADLIVVGSRGHGAVVGTLLGSVSRAVVRRADRPVLVAKHRAAVAV